MLKFENLEEDNNTLCKMIFQMEGDQPGTHQIYIPVEIGYIITMYFWL